MKKFLIVATVIFLAAFCVFGSPRFTAEKGQYGVGASFGYSKSVENVFDKGEGLKLEDTNKFGWVARVRFDYMAADNKSITIMASYDNPSRVLEANTYALKGSQEDEKLAKFFMGYSTYTLKDNFIVGVGVGPELTWDIENHTVGGGPASYVKTSLMIPGTGLSIDTIAKGSAEWLKEDSDARLYFDGDVSVGATYWF